MFSSWMLINLLEPGFPEFPLDTSANLAIRYKIFRVELPVTVLKVLSLNGSFTFLHTWCGTGHWENNFVSTRSSWTGKIWFLSLSSYHSCVLVFVLDLWRAAPNASAKIRKPIFATLKSLKISRDVGFISNELKRLVQISTLSVKLQKDSFNEPLSINSRCGINGNVKQAEWDFFTDMSVCRWCRTEFNLRFSSEHTPQICCYWSQIKEFRKLEWPFWDANLKIKSLPSVSQGKPKENCKEE